MGTSPTMGLSKKRSTPSQVLFLFFSCNILAALQLVLWAGSSLLHKPLAFPPALEICNVTHLSFDEAMMTLDKRSIQRAHIPNNGSGYAYGPYITKAGSTSMTKALQYASKSMESLSIDKMSEDDLDRYQFISVLRHPLERALAGFHQVEIFWNMNWINPSIEQRQLRWWNHTCLNSTWRDKSSLDYPCRGTDRQTSTEMRLQRLNDFLDEIKEKGFWDQHFAPMTYLLATNKLNTRTRYYDIEHLDTLAGIIVESSQREVLRYFFTRPRGGVENGQDWVVRWNELVELAGEYGLAREAVGKLCDLYKDDVGCLPYDVPECEAYGVSEA